MKKGKPLSLEAWLSFLSGELADSKNAQYAVFGVVIGFVLAFVGLTVNDPTPLMFMFTVTTVAIIGFGGACWLYLERKKSKRIRRLMDDIVTDKIRDVNEAKLRWERLKGRK
jgi:Flp pilus assembly protein TadB